MHSWNARACLLVMTALGCGGRISNDETSLATAPETIAEPPLPAEDAPWGILQLRSVERPDGTRRYDVPFFEVDLHPSGRAYAWTCNSPLQTGNGLPCPYAARRECLIGTIKLVGATWILSLFTSDEHLVAVGVVVEEPSADVRIDGSGPLQGRGRYVRVTTAPLNACSA